MKIKKLLVICSFVIGIGLVLGFALSTRQNVEAKGEEDFRITDGTLTAYVGSDTFVTLPSDVTVIDENAFANNTTLKSIELPKGLLEIHYNAFGGCTALEDITIPDSVIKVGPGAFKGCSGLKFAEIGKGVSSWGSGVFNDCTSLSYLVLNDKNLYLTYYDGALYNGDMTFLYQVLPGREGENFVTPSEVSRIDTYAFYNLSNIKNIKIAGTVSKIPTHAMSHMGSVENVILSPNVSEIQENAFTNNTNLKQIGIPADVEMIKDKAIKKCENVSIFTTKDSVADQYGKEKKIPVIYEAILPTDFNDSNPSGQKKPELKRKIVISNEIEKLPEEPTEVEQDEDEENTQEPQNEDIIVQNDHQEITRSVIVAGKAVFLVNNHMIHATEELKSHETKNEEEEIVTETDSSLDDDIDEENLDNSETIKVSTTIKTEEKEDKKEEKETDSKETTIPQRKYYKDEDLVSFTIPDTVKTIERLAFSRSALSEIDIPKSVKTIEYGAFYECKNLSKINIPDTVADISTKAFQGTPWLDEWFDHERGSGDFLVVGDHILLAYRGDSDTVEIPEGVKMIAAEAFKEHEEIVYVELTDSVTKIGADAFRDCKNLKTITGGGGLKTVTSGAFYGTEINEDDFKK